MLIASLEQKAALLAADAEQVEPQTMGQIALELGGRRIAGPDAVGDGLRELVKTAKAAARTRPSVSDQLVGRFGGFDLGLQTIGGEATPTFYLAGRCRYDAEPYQTGPGIVSALLAALASVAEQQAKTSEQLVVRRKRLEDLQIELVRPFEHEGRLTGLLVRQRELVKALDLDKDVAGSASLDGEAAARQAA